MKRLATGFGMAAILLVASTPGQTPPTAPRSISNSLEVLVTAGGNPLPDVDVTVTSTPEPSSSTAVPVTTTTTRTASDGRAVFRNLPAGNYGVRSERQGYLSLRTDGYAQTGSIVAVQLGSGTPSTTRQVKVPLVAGGIIAGKVENVRGRPLAGITVTAMQMTYQNGKQVLNQAVAISGSAAAQTDDLGEFRIFWVMPGDYFLQIASGSKQEERTYEASVFYPGTTNLSSATRVTVREGQETGGLRLVSAPPVGVKLSGDVVNIPEGFEPSQLILTPEGPLAKPQSISLNTDPNPKDSKFPFEIPGVPPGHYELRVLFTILGSNTGRNPGASTRLTVGAQDVQGILLTVHEVGEVHGRIVAPPEVQSYLRNLQPGANQQEQSLRVLFQPVEGTPELSSLRFEASPFESDRAAFSGASTAQGRYRLTAVIPLPQDAYIAELKQDGQSISDGIIEIGETDADVQIVIGRNPGSIQGTVLAGEAPNFVVVLLVPEGSRRKNFLLYRRQDIGSVPANPALFRFNFAGVAPGSYRLLALDSLQRGTELDPEVLARYESRGIAINVTSGATRELQVPLIRTRQDNR